MQEFFCQIDIKSLEQNFLPRTGREIPACQCTSSRARNYPAITFNFSPTEETKRGYFYIERTFYGDFFSYHPVTMPLTFQRKIYSSCWPYGWGKKSLTTQSTFGQILFFIRYFAFYDRSRCLRPRLGSKIQLIRAWP